VSRVYKILSQAEWNEALAKGRFDGSAVDLRDGFIHLSDAAQAPETARLHFAGRDDLVLLRLDAARLGKALRWEPSRGGALFPHFHGELDCGLVEAADAVPLGADGNPSLAHLLDETLRPK
jgi:uncharacterized protein (DUF952 family)